MRVLQEIFGEIEKPEITVTDLLTKNEELQDLQVQDGRGEVTSIGAIGEQINDVARSMISLGLVEGNTIAINDLSYDDALLVYFAAEQIGVNVVNVTGESIVGRLSEVRPRITVSRRATEDAVVASTGEFLILREGEGDGASTLDWNSFLSLRSFATAWELNKFRVISA